MAIDWKRHMIPLANNIINAASSTKKKKQQRDLTQSTTTTTTTTTSAAASSYVNQLQLATFDVYNRNNASVYKQLEIQALPSCHIYYKGRLLEEFIIKPKEFQNLVNTVQQYLNMSPKELKQRTLTLIQEEEEEEDEYEYATEWDL